MTAQYLRSSSSVERANSTAYSLGVRLSLAYNDLQSGYLTKRPYVYEVTTAGTSGATPPVYPTTPGTTVTDGTAVLTCRACTSWVNAAKFMNYVAPVCDDVLYVSQAHDESTPTTTTTNFPAVLATPIKVLCVQDSAEPPTTLTTGGRVVTVGASTLNVTGNIAVHGIEFSCGTGSNPNTMRFGSGANVQTYKNCLFVMGATSASAGIIVGDGGSTSSTSSEVIWEDCSMKFGAVGQVGITSQHCRFRWTGGAMLGPVAITNRFFGSSGSRGGTILAENLDLSAMGTSAAIASTSTVGDIVVRNCRLPAGWNGLIHTATQLPATQVWVDNCDDGDTNYRSMRSSYAGTSNTDTAYICTGGATNGTVPYSLKITTGTGASLPLTPHTSPEIARWNASIGIPLTVTMDFLHDSVTPLTDTDIYLELRYVGTSGVPLGTVVSNRNTALLLNATPVAHPSSAASWVTTGMTNPNKQKLTVTFTPQEVGYLVGRVVTGVASRTVYLDFRLQVT